MAKKPEIRSRFNNRGRLPKHTPGESLTQRNFATDANINNQVSKYLKGPAHYGMPIGNPNANRQLTFGEMPSETFHEMMNKVTDMKSKFMTLPARLRGKFANDPYQLLRFVEKPENAREAVRLGLINDPDIIDQVTEAERAEQAQQDLVDQADQEAKEAGQEARERHKAAQADPEAQPEWKTPSKPATRPQNGGKKA